MKKTIHSLTIGLALALGALPGAFAQGTMFTYQGRLTDNGAPGQVDYDFRFTLCDADGLPVASVPVKEMTAPVKNGLFKADLDFGPGVFTGDKCLLQIEVRPKGLGDWKKMLPLQELTPAPYAIYAGSAKTVTDLISEQNLAKDAVTKDKIKKGEVIADKIADNEVVKSLNGLKDAVTLSPGAGITIDKLGNDLKITASGGAAAGWSLTGNAGTTPGTHYLGTPDLKAVEFKVNGARALKLDVNNNFIAGSPYNFVRVGIGGAAIGGGGSSHGNPNSVLEGFGTIAGGLRNTVNGDSATIGGGYNNTIQTNASYATIGGGSGNLIRTNSIYATIAGGQNNAIRFDSDWGTIGGGSGNTISTNGRGATISGGVGDNIQDRAAFAAIVGGFNNDIQAGTTYSVIGGGANNTVQTNSPYSVIAGGERNWVKGAAGHATIGGGHYNTLADEAAYSVIAGGYTNRIGWEADRSTISGGSRNMIGDAAHDCTISGGEANTIMGGAFGSTIGGGDGNTIDRDVRGGTIGGGDYNTVGGDYGTVPGGDFNHAGMYGFAAGHHARAGYGSFVWADAGSDATFASTDWNQFLIRARGGVGIGTDNPAAALHVQGTTRTCKLIVTGGCDLAEPFDMSTKDVPSGAVVVIDENRPGHLKLSDCAYDSRVAGIVSGANGVNAGITLNQEGLIEGGQNVALSGRVYVQADANSAPIKPGDLLTTSDVPGHAMKAADREKAQGAILGKAMTALESGKGMVLVLVSLQ